MSLISRKSRNSIQKEVEAHLITPLNVISSEITKTWFARVSRTKTNPPWTSCSFKMTIIWSSRSQVPLWVLAINNSKKRSWSLIASRWERTWTCRKASAKSQLVTTRSKRSDQVTNLPRYVCDKIVDVYAAASFSSGIAASIPILIHTHISNKYSLFLV